MNRVARIVWKNIYRVNLTQEATSKNTSIKLKILKEFAKILPI
jgi:hypothetical protein